MYNLDGSEYHRDLRNRGKFSRAISTEDASEPAEGAAHLLIDRRGQENDRYRYGQWRWWVRKKLQGVGASLQSIITTVSVPTRTAIDTLILDRSHTELLAIAYEIVYNFTQINDEMSGGILADPCQSGSRDLSLVSQMLF